jgi:hypothetical protein
MSSKFERLDSETLFDGKFIAVRRDTFRHEDGEVVKRELVTHPGAVGVVVLDDDENLWFVVDQQDGFSSQFHVNFPAPGVHAVVVGRPSGSRVVGRSYSSAKRNPADRRRALSSSRGLLRAVHRIPLANSYNAHELYQICPCRSL